LKEIAYSIICYFTTVMCRKFSKLFKQNDTAMDNVNSCISFQGIVLILYYSKIKRAFQSVEIGSTYFRWFVVNLTIVRLFFGSLIHSSLHNFQKFYIHDNLYVLYIYIPKLLEFRLNSYQISILLYIIICANCLFIVMIFFFFRHTTLLKL